MGKASITNKIVEELNRNPDRRHWEAFRDCLSKSGAKYYKAFFPKKLKKRGDLLAAYVIVYDQKIYTYVQDTNNDENWQQS